MQLYLWATKQTQLFPPFSFKSGRKWGVLFLRPAWHRALSSASGPSLQPPRRGGALGQLAVEASHTWWQFGYRYAFVLGSLLPLVSDGLPPSVLHARSCCFPFPFFAVVFVHPVANSATSNRQTATTRPCPWPPGLAAPMSGPCTCAPHRPPPPFIAPVVVPPGRHGSNTVASCPLLLPLPAIAAAQLAKVNWALSVAPAVP